MAYISVDFDTISATEAKINDYIEKHKAAVRGLNSSYREIEINESGSDFSLLNEKWDAIDNENSTYAKMLVSLERYALFLRHCAKNYKIAQDNARYRASNI